MVPYISFNSEISKRLKSLVSLDERTFAKVLKALGDDLDAFAARAQVHDYALRNFPEISGEFAFAIEALIPLVLNEQYAEISPDEVAKGVLDGIERTTSATQNWTAVEKKLLKARIKKALSDSNIKLRARAWALVLERPRVLDEARILTDLRPIFSNKNPAVLEACTVIHTLVLEVMEGQEARTLHIALDTKDLANLKANISRAEQKEKVLGVLASKAGVLSLQIR